MIEFIKTLITWTCKEPTNVHITPFPILNDEVVWIEAGPMYAEDASSSLIMTGHAAIYRAHRGEP